MLTLHSHTHCQVLHANTQAKTWQRVCLSNRTTDLQTDKEKEALGGNSTYPKGGVTCSKDSFVVTQTLVFQIKFCGKSPALRVAAKRVCLEQPKVSRQY
jgi:hypothetical protein